MCVEIFPFDDPTSRFHAIDRLEGFHPGGPSLYGRVLAPVWADGAVLPVWLYVGEAGQYGRRLLPNGV